MTRKQYYSRLHILMKLL